MFGVERRGRWWRHVVSTPRIRPAGTGSGTTSETSASACHIGDLGGKVRLSGTSTGWESTFVGHDNCRGPIVLVIDEIRLAKAEKVDMWTGRLWDETAAVLGVDC